jgi:tetratricopeptide (TPR) repeat protein
MNIIEHYQALAAQQRWSEALTVIEEIIAAAPEIDTSWFNKGVCLDELERYNEAAEAFIQAQQRNKTDYGIHYRIVRSAFLADNFGLLFEFLDYSCSLDPDVLQLIIDDPEFEGITERKEFSALIEKYEE